MDTLLHWLPSVLRVCARQLWHYPSANRDSKWHLHTWPRACLPLVIDTSRGACYADFSDTIMPPMCLESTIGPVELGSDCFALAAAFCQKAPGDAAGRTETSSSKCAAFALLG